jgi:hypothetical protein
MCVFISVHLLSESFPIPRRLERDIIINVQKVFNQSIRYSCQILTELGYSRHIFENPQISNFTKILPVEAEMYHADRRTDRHDEANIRFSYLRDSA